MKARRTFAYFCSKCHRLFHTTIYGMRWCHECLDKEYGQAEVVARAATARGGKP